MKEVEKEGKRESRRETKRGREEKGQHQLESQVSSRFKSCHHDPHCLNQDRIENLSLLVHKNSNQSSKNGVNSNHGDRIIRL